jgi:mono/diheme cytochrome c family protein
LTYKRVLWLLLLIFGLAACSPAVAGLSALPVEEVTAEAEANTSQPAGMGMGMGLGSNMMARHHARIPAEYAGLNNPIPADEESLARGAELFGTYCAACHGDGGMGDGPAGQALDPPPAPVAHTSRMLGDDYLFWRISEGGTHEPFSSAMPRWQEVLDDDARWDVINYIRALGSGQVVPGQLMGGAAFDAAAEAARHEEMAAEGVQQGVLTQAEADSFLAVHAEMDRLMGPAMEGQSGGMDNMQSIMLDQLLGDGRITQSEADIFSDAHERLLAAGIMQ